MNIQIEYLRDLIEIDRGKVSFLSFILEKKWKKKKKLKFS